VVAYYFGSESAAVRPYVGGSIGAAWLSDTMIDGRDLSTRFQFEDRVGIGVAWRRLDAYLSYVHYSNASVKAPNDGIDGVMLTVGWALQ
jgi:lipid A 3-O-deacylase